MTTLSGWSIDLTTSPRTITIPIGTETVTAQDQVDTVRKLEDQFLSMGHPHFMDATGKEGGGVTGIVIVYRDSQIAFEARSDIPQQGTVTTTDTFGITLIDSSALFLTNGVNRGDILVNATTAAHTTVIRVDSETVLKTLPLVGGSDNEFGIGDAYTIFDYHDAILTSGDVFAVDSSDVPISPILNTFGVGSIVVEQSTSPGAAPPSVSDIVNGTMIESYPADGQPMTLAQGIYSINQMLSEFARTDTTVSVKKRDGTEAFPLTLDSATAPTSSTQSG